MGSQNLLQPNFQTSGYTANSATSNTDSEQPRSGQGNSAASPDPVSPERSQQTLPAITPKFVLTVSPELKPYIYSALPSWADIVDDADGLRQQLGISRSAWIDACQTMGRYQAATAVAVIAAKRETIRSPGGYLRGMIGRAQNGELHLSNSLCATGSRGHGCTPLCDAAAHPYHRPILGGGPLDSVHRLLHPSAERRDGCRPARSHGEPPRRRAQSRPDAHGRGLHDRRPRQARLGG